MKFKVIFLSLLCILLTAANCKKEQTGGNIFSCKIDGVTFKPSEQGGLFGSPPIVISNSSDYGFTLTGKYYGDRGDRIPKNISLNLPYIKSIGTYNLNTPPNYGAYEIDVAGGAFYQTDTMHTGTVTATHCDTVNEHYSGTFYFTCIDKNTGKVVKISDGVFDIKQ